MRTGDSALFEFYYDRLNTMLHAEQCYLKCYAKISFAALTDELRTALSPVSFHQHEHIDRLKQCIKLLRRKRLKVRGKAEIVQHSEIARKSTKSPSLQRDLKLLDVGMKLIGTAQVNYDELLHMSSTLGQEMATSLLDQCRKDMQNAYGYLVQISDNIIYPLALRSMNEYTLQLR